MKNKDADLIQRLGRSELYSEFKQALGASTGLPLTLRPEEFWRLAHRGQPYENPFCAMIAQTNRGCGACLQAEQRAIDEAHDRPTTVRCFAGLCHTAVPIKLGKRMIGFLQTGQVALDLPSPTRFEAIVCQLTDWGPHGPEPVARRLLSFEGVFAGPIRGVHLLEIFGQQLSALANRMMLQDAEAEPPMIRRARAYIAGHHSDPIGLDEVPNAMHVSTFYFCKMFKKAAGLAPNRARRAAQPPIARKPTASIPHRPVQASQREAVDAHFRS